jgi:TM2 domain-containing membrane protein YozV
MNTEQAKEFIAIYRQRRKDQNTILGGILAGIVGIHGIHRFMLGQVGWGLVYLFTMGFCKIGWIIDLVNYRKITIDYNVKIIMDMSQSTIKSKAGF